MTEMTPLAPMEIRGDGERVVAADDGDVAEGEDFASEVEGAGGFLDGDDVGVLGEARDSRRGHGDARSAGDVVEDDGQIDAVGQGHEVAVEAFLAGLVVVGIDGEPGGGAGLPGEGVEFDGLGGGVGADAGDDRDAAARRGDGGFDDALVLGPVEGGRFAGGSDGDEAVDAAGDLAFDLFAEAVLVELAFAKRG